MMIDKDRKKRIKRRLKGKRKLGLHLLLIFVVISFYIIFSNNIVVDEKTGAIDIIKTEKRKEFKTIYTGSTVLGGIIDIDIDLDNVYLTGGIVDITFSNNKDFKFLSSGDKTNNKVKFGYMLGKSRNKDKVFRLGKVVDSLKTFHYNIIDNYEGEDLAFRAANLDGGELFVKIIVIGEKIIKED